MPLPSPTEYPTYYAKYITLVPEEDVVAVLKADAERTAAFLAAIPPADEFKRHPPYTWTIRQVLGHILDAERVFAYRALWFARGETAALPGFDEGPFAANAPHDRVPLPDLLDEYRHLRAASVHLFAQLDAAAWARKGVASIGEITVRALAYCVAGHERHHMTIARKRFGGG